MARKEKHQAKAPANSKAATLQKGNQYDLFDRINLWFEKNEKLVFYSLLLLSTLFSYLLFDAKVSDGLDDSSYIERAWSFANEGKYPYFQGPGYPVFLSIFIKLFGLNVIALKSVSVFCQLGFVWVTYKTFVKRIPYTVLFALIAFISFNDFIQFYSSQTFTETFFLFVQSICLYITFKIIDSIDPKLSWVDGFKQNYMKWILFGLMFVLLSISKSIAFVTIVGVIVYFVFNKNYKQAVYAFVAFFAIRLVYQWLATAMFGPNDANQLEMMLRKELYKPSAGHEDFSGMLSRFYDNCVTYFSLHVFRILHLRPLKYDITSFVPFFAFLTSLFIGIFSFLSYKKNKFVFFTSIYLVVLCGGIFFGVQAANMQDRLIIIVMPFIFLLFFYGIYEFAKRYSGFQTIFIVIATGMLGWTIICSLGKMKENAKTGYTPDYDNFLKMSKYCADSLPSDAQVLSRKPAMSFIYGNGKKFVGQFVTTSMDADTVLMGWKKQNIKYVIIANLRMDPKKNNKKIINTIHRMLGPVINKYPGKVKLVKTIGTSEKCELYEINY